MDVGCTLDLDIRLRLSASRAISAVAELIVLYRHGIRRLL